MQKVLLFLLLGFAALRNLADEDRRNGIDSLAVDLGVFPRTAACVIACFLSEHQDEPLVIYAASPDCPCVSSYSRQDDSLR